MISTESYKKINGKVDTLHDLYNNKTRMKAQFPEIKYLFLTINIWTESLNTKGFLGLTAQKT